MRHPRTDETATVSLIREYAHEQPVYGYRIIAAMLKHDGYRINRKRVYRIWRQEGLQLPRRKAVKRRYGDAAGALRRAGAPNEVWTYDFLEGRTERGGKLRMLTVLDEYTWECLTIHVARSISSRQVIQVLEWLFLLRGAPGHLRSDNGPEFVAYALQEWLRCEDCACIDQERLFGNTLSSMPLAFNLSRASNSSHSPRPQPTSRAGMSSVPSMCSRSSGR